MRSIIAIHLTIATVLWLMLALMPFYMMAADAMDACMRIHSSDTCITALR